MIYPTNLKKALGTFKTLVFSSSVSQSGTVIGRPLILLNDPRAALGKQDLPWLFTENTENSDYGIQVGRLRVDLGPQHPIDRFPIDASGSSQT